MPNKQLLVCDLDNTLYDWVGYFVPAFYAMVGKAIEILQCDEDKLLDDLRTVHQRYGDSEQPFALLETDIVRRTFDNAPADVLMRQLDPAFHAFNSVRKNKLKLHPQVRETIELVSAHGVRLVAHTESKLYGVVDRLSRLGLTEYFSRIYCRERSSSLHPVTAVRESWLQSFPMQRVVELSHHQAKPNPAVLQEICANEGVPVGDVAYVGDSVARDVLMAKRAGVFAIWAAYGADHGVAEYAALVRVSHWTKEEVTREQRLKEEARRVQPDYVAQSSFAEVATALGLDNTSHLWRKGRYA